MNKYLYFIVLIIIAGCTAVGVPTTSDPYKKIEQSYQLMSTNRPIPAEFNAQEALTLFKEKGDKFGEAEANFFLGNFYKHKSGWKNTNKEEFINKSIEHLNLAINSYKSINENIQASKAVFSLANAYRGLGDKTKYCQSYKESLALYETNLGAHKTFEVKDPRFKTPDALISTYISQLCGNNT